MCSNPCGIPGTQQTWPYWHSPDEARADRARAQTCQPERQVHETSAAAYSEVSLVWQSCVSSNQWACSRTDQLVHVKSKPWCDWILLANAATSSVSYTLCRCLMLVRSALRSSLVRSGHHPVSADLPMPLPRSAPPPCDGIHVCRRLRQPREAGWREVRFTCGWERFPAALRAPAGHKQPCEP